MPGVVPGAVLGASPGSLNGVLSAHYHPHPQLGGPSRGGNLPAHGAQYEVEQGSEPTPALNPGAGGPRQKADFAVKLVKEHRKNDTVPKLLKKKKTQQHTYSHPIYQIFPTPGHTTAWFLHGFACESMKSSLNKDLVPNVTGDSKQAKSEKRGIN